MFRVPQGRTVSAEPQMHLSFHPGETVGTACAGGTAATASVHSQARKAVCPAGDGQERAGIEAGHDGEEKGRRQTPPENSGARHAD